MKGFLLLPRLVALCVALKTIVLPSVKCFELISLKKYLKSKKEMLLNYFLSTTIIQLSICIIAMLKTVDTYD